jgi:hypothetical protein
LSSSEANIVIFAWHQGMKLCIGLSGFDFIAYSAGFAGYVDDKNLQVNAYSYLVEWLFLGLRKKQGCVAELTMELSILHAAQR